MVDTFDHKTEVLFWKLRQSSQRAPLIRKIWNAHAVIFYSEWPPPGMYHGQNRNNDLHLALKKYGVSPDQRLALTCSTETLKGTRGPLGYFSCRRDTFLGHHVDTLPWLLCRKYLMAPSTINVESLSLLFYIHYAQSFVKWKYLPEQTTMNLNLSKFTGLFLNRVLAKLCCSVALIIN
jgi:hypothetical protein